jgi:hypothetical protein
MGGATFVHAVNFYIKDHSGTSVRQRDKKRKVKGNHK